MGLVYGCCRTAGAQLSRFPEICGAAHQIVMRRALTATEVQGQQLLLIPTLVTLKAANIKI